MRGYLLLIWKESITHMYDFTQMVNFLTLIPECDSDSRALLDLFISSDASVCSTIAFLSMINSYYVVVSVSMNFPITSKQDDPIHRIAYDYSCADWGSLHDHLRDIPWEDIFKFSISAAREFWERVEVEINVYISHRKYQVKLHSSLWFSAAFTASIVHRNQFFCFNQQNKPCKSKKSWDKIIIVAKTFLNLPNLHMLLKQKSFSLPRNLISVTFGKISEIAINKAKPAILSLFNCLEVLSSTSVKIKLSAKTFVKTLILMTQVSLNLLYLLELIWNCIIFQSG